MKKCVTSTLLPVLQAFVILLALISISCKSTPASSSVAVAGGSTQAANVAEEARKRAMDFEAPAYFPSDWEEAEAKYAAANDSASINASAGTYNELFKKTIPLYAQAREDEILAARDELIQTGFTSVVPEYLQNADNIALEALAQYEAEDYYKAKDTAAEALKEYETLLTGAKVYLTRQEIINRGFRDYDPENFDKAEEVAQTAMNEYEAGNKDNAVSNAEEALLRFNIVLKNGWTAYASEQRAAAIAERERAIENKANIAARESFREADNVFNQAEDDFKAEKFDSSAVEFTEAEARFVLAGQETDEKRRKAEETIKLAEEKIEESSETASEAERIIEGGSR